MSGVDEAMETEYGWENGKFLSNGHRVSAWEDEKSSGTSQCGMDTMLWMDLMALNCTFKMANLANFMF